MIKTRFPFLYASTSLDTRTLTIAWKRNFESCMSIRCLVPQHIFQFFPFLPRVFPLPLATLLITVSSSSILKWAIEIKNIIRVCNKLLFPENLDPSLLTPGGPVVPLVCGFRRRDSLLAWRELFASLFELKISPFWRNTTTLSESLGFIYLTDFRQISPKHSKNNDKRKCVGKF